MKKLLKQMKNRKTWTKKEGEQSPSFFYVIKMGGVDGV